MNLLYLRWKYAPNALVSFVAAQLNFGMRIPRKVTADEFFFPSFSLKNILKQCCYQIFNVPLEAYCNSCSQRKNIQFTSFVKKYILIFMDKYCHWPAFCSYFCKKKLTFYWKCSNLLYFQIVKHKILILYFNFLHIRNELFYKMQN